MKIMCSKLFITINTFSLDLLVNSKIKFLKLKFV